MPLTPTPAGLLTAAYTSRTVDADGKRHSHWLHRAVVALAGDGTPFVVKNSTLMGADDACDDHWRYVGLSDEVNYRPVMHAAAPPRWYVVASFEADRRELVGSVLFQASDDPIQVQAWLPVLGWTVHGSPLVYGVQDVLSDGNCAVDAEDTDCFHGTVLRVVYEPTRTVSGLASAVLTENEAVK